MDKPKMTKKEILKRNRLAARERRERIKSDPIMYQKYKENEKERYKKRKSEKKILPISEMTAKNKKKARKRNRENSRAYYKRQRKKVKLEPIEEEVEINSSEVVCNIIDPFKLEKEAKNSNEAIVDPLKSLSSQTLHVYSLPSSDAAKTVYPEIYSVAPNYSKDCYEDCRPSISSSNFETSSKWEPFVSLTPRPACSQSTSSADTTITSDTSQCNKNINTSCNFEEIDSLSTMTYKDESSVQFSTVCCEKTSQKPKRKINSPLLLLRRHKYKTNKEIWHLRRKIEELKCLNNKYRKQIIRLKKSATTRHTIIPKKEPEKNN